MKNISNLIQDESQINQLRLSGRRKHPSPQIQIYDKLKTSIQQDFQNSYTFKLKTPTHSDKKLFEYKNQKDLELLVSLIMQACLHMENCIHEQLYEKLTRQDVQIGLRIQSGLDQKIKKVERYFENQLQLKKCNKYNVKIMINLK